MDGLEGGRSAFSLAPAPFSVSGFSPHDYGPVTENPSTIPGTPRIAEKRVPL